MSPGEKLFSLVMVFAAGFALGYIIAQVVNDWRRRRDDARRC